MSGILGDDTLLLSRADHIVPNEQRRLDSVHVADNSPAIMKGFRQRVVSPSQSPYMVMVFICHTVLCLLLHVKRRFSVS